MRPPAKQTGINFHGGPWDGGRLDFYQARPELDAYVWVGLCLAGYGRLDGKQAYAHEPMGTSIGGFEFEGAIACYQLSRLAGILRYEHVACGCQKKSSCANGG